MSLVLPIVLVYFGVVVFVIALLQAASRGDEAMAGGMPELRVSRPAEPVNLLPQVDAFPDHENLGDLASHIRAMAGVERVCVVVGDDVDSGMVVACADAPGWLGARVRVHDQATTRMLPRDEAAACGLAGDTPGGAAWVHAQVPLHGCDGASGAIEVAARRVLPFTTREVRLIERLARRGAPEFERRRQERSAA